MTQQIYDTKNFPFANIDLGKPYNLNGMYFIKMFVKDSPIYVQPPKCFIKQGILKSGKKWFCDLVFSIEDGYFLTWLEQIEEIAKRKIFENRANWFETELDEHDIENSLVSPYKMFRSGKLFIIRANLSSTLDKCDLKIYDESENEIQPEDVKEETEVITIIELKGIKCSARNFQFVFDVRQMLLVSPVKIFEKCIIVKNAGRDPVKTPDNAITGDGLPSKVIEEEVRGHSVERSSNEFVDRLEEPRVKEENEMDAVRSPTEKQEEDTELPTTSSKGNVRSPTAEQERGISAAEARVGLRGITGDGLPSKVIEICEFEIDLEDLEKNDVFQLKPRNDVYYKLYKEAKQKAKEAKLLALSNYLEAKRLKTTYLLEDSSDSSDDDDEDTAEE